MEIVAVDPGFSDFSIFSFQNIVAVGAYFSDFSIFTF
jgi:hypothetical protein